jgi:molecular chaperone GrpE (heat shock protein)
MNGRGQRPLELDVWDELGPLHAWRDDDGSDRIAAVEDDIRGLLRELAEARSALARQEGEQRGRTERLLLSLIEVLDAFEHVFGHIGERGRDLTPETESWVGNFRTVYRLLQAALADQGVAPIEAPEGDFDPGWHSVVDTVADPSRPDGEIVSEQRRGYTWGDRVLRKTEVVAVRNEGGG